MFDLLLNVALHVAACWSATGVAATAGLVFVSVVRQRRDARHLKLLRERPMFAVTGMTLIGATVMPYWLVKELINLRSDPQPV